MLTVQEAERAIRGLDTPLDVIQGACLAVLYPSRTEGPDPDIGDVVKELLMGLRQRFADPSQVCEVVWTAAAWQAMSSCREGAEMKMFSEMQGYIKEEYKNVLGQTLDRILKEDPRRGARWMMGLLKEMNESAASAATPQR